MITPSLGFRHDTALTANIWFYAFTSLVRTYYPYHKQKEPYLIYSLFLPVFSGFLLIWRSLVGMGQAYRLECNMGNCETLIKRISLLLFLCGFMAANAFTATLTVTKISDTADGVCDADCSLREAIIAANSDDVIVFSPLFNTPQTVTLTGGQISIDKNLTIAGAGANLLTVSGNNAGRIFYISDNAVVALSGTRLTGGLVATSSGPNGGAIYLTDSTLTLTNMTLSGNTARFTSQQPPASFGRGGAIYSINSTLSVINSTINNNTAPSGGGIDSAMGIVNISSSTISNNSGDGVLGRGLESTGHTLINVVNSTFNGNSGTAIAGLSGRTSVINTLITNNGGGGISNDDSQAILTIDRSIISNNETINFARRPGGGIINHGTATISNTAINNNRATGAGGGIFNTGIMNIISSAVTNNRALVSGGGIFNAIGRLFLTNSTVSGNVADSGSGTGNNPGGGIYNSSNSVTPGGNLILTNSTIVNNRATGLGGGLRQDATGTVALRNTIIAGNSSNTNEIDVSGTIVSQGFNLIGNTTGSSGWIDSDLLDRNPLLAPLGNNGGPTLTHALLPGSPAINAGNNALAVDPTTNLRLIRDQRGFARSIGGDRGGGIVDIGALESNIADSPVTLSGRVLTSGGRGISNARITLTDANGAIIYAQTNSFGYYRFVNLPPGTTYTITIIYKRYRSNSPQIVTVETNRNDFNFIAFL